MARALVVGLDTVGEADLAGRLDRGELPTLAGLRARGAWCSLEVDPLCCAEHVWPTVVTGREPARGGTWNDVTFDPATYRYGTGGTDLPPFWAHLTDRTVVTLDVPDASVVPGVPGVQVTDWFAHPEARGATSWPADAGEELEATVGPNPARPLEYAGTWNDASWIERYAAALVESVDRRVDAVEHLLDATPGWDLAVVAYPELHQLTHHTGHGLAATSVLGDVPTAPIARQALDDVLRALDGALARLVARLDPDDVLVVFSPKGADDRSDVASNVLAPELLHRLAFGRPFLRQPSRRRWARRGRLPVVLPAGMAHVVAMRALRVDSGSRWLRFRVRHGLSRLADTVAPGLAGRARLARRRRQGARVAARGGEGVAGVPPADGPYDGFHVAAWYRQHWPEMRAFVLPSFSDLHVRINVAGRERDGIVPAAEYRAACDEVEGALRRCRDPPTGAPVVAAVHRPRGDDPFATAGPVADLVVSWARDLDALEHPEVGLVGPYPAWRCAGHSNEGFALVAGGRIAAARLGGPRLVDLTATILDLVGAPTAPVDGTPIPLDRTGAVHA